MIKYNQPKVQVIALIYIGMEKVCRNALAHKDAGISLKFLELTKGGCKLFQKKNHYCAQKGNKCMHLSTS